MLIYSKTQKFRIKIFNMVNMSTSYVVICVWQPIGIGKMLQEHYLSQFTANVCF